MLCVIRQSFGGFKVNDETRRKCGLPKYDVMVDDDRIVRHNDALIDLILSGECREKALKVVHIPMDATDWRIENYGGFESVICVVDGKIRNAEILA